MAKTKYQRMLKEHGFYFERNGKRHELWTNGKIRIALSHGEPSMHTFKSFLVRLRKGVPSENYP